MASLPARVGAGKLGKNAEALEDLDRSIDLTQDYPDQELYQERAEVKFRLGDIAGARSDLEAATEASDKLVDSVRIQAGIRARLGRLSEVGLSARRYI